MKKYNLFLAINIIALSLFLSACSEASKEEQHTVNNPNIILMIGDGMGLSELSASFYYGDMMPVFTEFNNIGLINTSSKKQKITDSAAGATAFACGQKTYNGGLGVNVDSVPIPNITEVLSKVGYKTGLVATSSITHATPAGFYAHVKSRNQQFDIAKQLTQSKIDFFAAGGMKFFNQRPDSVNLLNVLSDNGFVVNAEDFNYNYKRKYGFILAEDGMPSKLNGRDNFLADYTSHAIDYLSNSGDNFFLMVEGSQIDWGGHDNNSEYLIGEMLDFEKAVRTAFEFAKKDRNTIVIVLADHETGGFTLGANNGNYAEIKPTFSTGGHSATLIPVLTYGPGSDEFRGIYQNNEVFHNMLKITSQENAIDKIY